MQTISCFLHYAQKKTQFIDCKSYHVIFNKQTDLECSVGYTHMKYWATALLTSSQKYHFVCAFYIFTSAAQVTGNVICM